MTYSSRLTELLDLRNTIPVNPTMDLTVLGETFAHAFHEETARLRRLLRCKGTVPLQGLCLHIHRTAEWDSAVRDVITSGHLGKVLIRWKHLRYNDYSLIGLRQSVLDDISRRERADYLRRHNNLLSQVFTPEMAWVAKAILEEEKRILGE
jgi:hypothetical protein